MLPNENDRIKILPGKLNAFIKEQAALLGFDETGITAAMPLTMEASHFNDWLSKGYQSGMSYLERNIDKRTDPSLMVVGAKTIIVLLTNYYPESLLPETDNYVVAKYAYGEDYHEVIRKRLNGLISKIKELAGDISIRGFVDSAPVLERAWAVKAGLGWIGKNTCLINPQKGSFFFISCIITDLETDYDQHQCLNMCGSCRRCMDACPTGALVEPMMLDARKCISYLTIENKTEIPEDFRGQLKDRIFGCDICQDVCPWNRKSIPNSEAAFKPDNKLYSMSKEKWINLSKEDFNNLFRKSAIKRAKYFGLMRNIKFVNAENSVTNNNE